MSSETTSDAKRARTDWPDPASRPSAYIFTFPFWIYVDAADPPSVQLLARDGVKLRVYPPFRSAPANAVPGPAVTAGAIPFLKGADPLPPNAQTFFRTLAVIPLLTPDLSPKASALFVADVSWGNKAPRTFPMDSIRFDALNRDPTGRVVDSVVVDLLTQLRYLSRQWWIGRSMDPLSGYLRHIAPIRQNGSFIDYPESHATFGTASGDELPINRKLWNTVGNQVAARAAVPIYSTLLQDARLFARARDVRRSVLDGAGACEHVKELTFERIWQVLNPQGVYQRGKVLRGYQLPDHLSGVLLRLNGRSFQQEHPQDADVIRRLWSARNSVAHGREATYRSPSGPVEVTPELAFEMSRAAERCTSWLNAL